MQNTSYINVKHANLWFSDWLRESNIEVSYATVQPTELAEKVKTFYAEVRNKKKEKYNHNTMKSLRAGINRHIQSPPFNRSIDIVKDKEFKSANQVLEGYIKASKQDGKDTTKHKEAMSDSDWKKLQNSPSLSTTNPTTLQNKVIIDLLVHFGRRGREGMRQLKTDSYEELKDDDGRSYIVKTFNEVSKTNQTSGKEDDINYDNAIMYEQKGHPRCPVASYRKYIRHLDPSCDSLLPYALDHINYVQKGHVWQGKDIWYTTDPIGENPLGKLVKKISIKEKLSKVYTNHCIRASVITRLSRKGVEDRAIANLTNHRNLNSLKHYAAKPTIEEKGEISDKLFDDGPTNKKRILASSSQHEPIQSTSTAPCTAVSVQNCDGVNDENCRTVNIPIHNVPHCSSQVMSSMFAGANFTNATININWKN